MASTTAPAAIPDPPSHPPATPGDTTQTATPRPSLFAAVDPARPTDDDSGFLLPATSADDDTLLAQSPDGPSSDAFHDKPADPNNSTSSSTEGKETRVVRAWLLAGAERWRKGADARNKALDIRRAQAQALQIKRAETVNRSEKIVGGNTSTGSKTDSGKSSSSKTSNSGGPKGNSGTGGTGSGGSGGGRSGGSSRGPAGGGSGGGAGRGQSGTQRKDTKNANGGSGSGGKGWKDNATHKSAGGGKDVKNRSAGGGGKGSHVEHKTARETPPSRTPKTDKTPTAPKPAAPKPAKTDTTIKTLKADKTAPPPSSSGANKNASSRTPKAATQTDTCGTASGIDLTKRKKNKDTDAKTTPPTSPTPGGTDKNPGAKGGTKTPPTPKKDPKDPKTVPVTPKPGTGAADKPRPPGPSINTQPTREAGYRDGTRIGKAEAHVRAYKDGVRDGRDDIKKAADREKGRLDKAREQRKQTPTPDRPAPAVPPKPTIPPKPTTPPTAPTTAPDPRTILMKPKETPVATPTTQPTGPVPIQVTNASPAYLALGAGSDRSYIGRGEVRNLAGHQHRLTGRKDTVTKIAERAKVYEAHAQQQTKNITNLLEQAKSSKVKGGEKVIAVLAKLEDASKVQEAKAREVVKRAERSADACAAVSANLEVRYGDIYRVAANSADGPAEFNYYRDLGYVNA